MIKAVLFDLDNTLLGNANDIFVPSYLHLADTFFHERWQVANISQLLIQATRAMLGPRDLRQSNTALAESVLAHATQRPIPEVHDAFVTFYAEAYPQLQSCVERLPLAAEIINLARHQGLAVVIATNPMYPETAIRQRLMWAGLDDDFALVTHSDNMHFVKPDPAYYAEIIARVGIEPDEAVMVGDSDLNDIVPAARLGLNTYKIAASTPDQRSLDADGSGTLDDYFQIMHQPDWRGYWQPRPLSKEAIAPQFQGNMAALFGFLAEVKDHQWHQRPDPDEWSIIQTLCHLLESEQTVHRPRLKLILAEDNPFLLPAKAPLQDALPCDDDGYQIAEQFLTQRLETMQWLNNLEPQHWQRPARHSTFGLTTLLEMAQFTAQHDRLHISQICQTLGKCTP